MNLLLLSNDTFIVSGPDVLEGTFEVTLWAIEVGIGLVFGVRKVRVNELNKSVQVLGSDRLILLVEVVDVAIEDLDEKLDGDGCIHASISNTKSTLEALQNSFPVTVKLLFMSVRNVETTIYCMFLHSWDPPPRAAGSQQPTKGDLQGRLHGTDLAS